MQPVVSDDMDELHRHGALTGQYSRLERNPDVIGAMLQTELILDPMLVGVHGLGAGAELPGDLGAAAPSDHGMIIGQTMPRAFCSE